VTITLRLELPFPEQRRPAGLHGVTLPDPQLQHIRPVASMTDASTTAIDRCLKPQCPPSRLSNTFGNAGRGYLTGHGTKTVDVSVQRNFSLPIKEISRLEFRAEAFNSLSTPQFGIPGATLETAQFGSIAGTASANRQLQFGLKVLF
jgi:hypothetical protein